MKIFKTIVVVFFFLTFFADNLIASTDSDSLHSLSTYEDSTRAIGYGTVADDSTIIKKKEFNSALVEELKSDSDMHYNQPPTAAESLWSRIMKWFVELIQMIFSNASNTGWGKILIYAAGIAIIVIVVMIMLRVNAFQILYSAKGAPVDGAAIHENIHEMDFEKLLQEAVQQNDYRRGVRLLFLYALKILADKHLIRWEPGKTNHEYISELQQAHLKEGLDDLSYYFDYAWYGNFKVNAEIFQQANSIFSSWRQTVR